jgi:hypothetical protein
MAGCIGPILAVRLLGRASIFLMTPVSGIVSLGRIYRTTSLYRGQKGRLELRPPGPRSPGPAGPLAELSDLAVRTGLRGRGVRGDGKTAIPVSSAGQARVCWTRRPDRCGCGPAPGLCEAVGWPSLQLKATLTAEKYLFCAAAATAPRCLDVLSGRDEPAGRRAPEDFSGLFVIGQPRAC